MSLRTSPASARGARRAALKEERRRQKARDNFTAKAPDPGREIPPRLNPDAPDMVDRVKACYVGLTQWMADFERGIVNLADAGMLNRCVSLSGHSRDLMKAVDASMADALKWHPAAKLEDVHRLADHAKYVYAVGSRDIAALQYQLAWLAGRGHLNHEENRAPAVGPLPADVGDALPRHHLRRRDDRTWDGMWDWSDNTYSDGRQVMAQVRVKNWYELVCNWPYNEFLCGNGPIQEHPRGSVCQICRTFVTRTASHWNLRAARRKRRPDGVRLAACWEKLDRSSRGWPKRPVR